VKKALLMGCLLLVSGCGAYGAESLLREQIKATNDLAAAVENNESERVKELQYKWVDLNKKVRALTMGEKKKLEDGFKGQWQEAMTKLDRALSSRNLDGTVKAKIQEELKKQEKAQW
jgi:hypothetical protein